MRKVHLAVAFLAVVFVTFSSFAGTIEKRFTGRTWYVSASAPEGGDGSQSSPYKYIQSAVEAAQNDDKIRLSAGVYSNGVSQGSRVFVSKRLRISGAGRGKTVILGASLVRCMLFNASASGSLVQDLTLRDGDVNTNGGGACFESDSGECYIINCSIENCVSAQAGGATFGRFVIVSTLIDRCTSTIPNAGAIAGCIGAYNMIAVSCGRTGDDVNKTCTVLGANTFGPFVNCTFSSNLGCCVPPTNPEALVDLQFYNTLFVTHNWPATLTNCNARCCASTQKNQLRVGERNIGDPSYGTLDYPYVVVSTLTDWRLRSPTGNGLNPVDQGENEWCQLDFIPNEYRNVDFYGNPRIQGGNVDIGAAEGKVSSIECALVYVDNTIADNLKLTINARQIVAPADTDVNPANGFYLSAEKFPASVDIGAKLSGGAEVFAYTTSITNNMRGCDGKNPFNSWLYPDMNGHCFFTIPRPADVLPRDVKIGLKLASAVRYVSTAGVDDPHGTKDAPYKTLQYAANQSSDYTVLHVAAGTYDQGGATSPTDSDDTQTNKTKSRLLINYKSLRFIGDDGAAKTIIKGQYTDQEGDRYDGCGSNAYRCVHFVGNYSLHMCVQGFTLANGATCGNPTSLEHQHYGGTSGGWDSGANVARGNYGGGGMLCGVWNNKMAYGTLQDCIITNCVAYWGAATYAGEVKRCIIVNNHTVPLAKDKAAARNDYVSLQAQMSDCLILSNKVQNAIFNSDGTFQVQCTIENEGSLYGNPVNCIHNGYIVGNSSVKAGLRDPAHGNFHLVEGMPGLTAGKFTSSSFSRGAGVDLDGVMLDYSQGTIPVGCFYSSVDASDWYVNASSGNDSYDGTTPAKAKRTLNAILPLALLGDTVHAAEGVYSDNAQIHKTLHYNTSASQRKIIPAVGIVPEGVNLVADGAQERTIIEGQWGGIGGKGVNPLWTLDQQNMTFGEDAVRGLVMEAGSKVAGFTFRNCAALADKYCDGTSTSEEDRHGGAILGAKQVVIEDCFFTNCVASSCSAFSGACTARRCKFIRMGAAGNQAVTEGGSLYDCFIDWCFDGPVRKSPAVVNCVFGPNCGISFIPSEQSTVVEIASGGVMRNTIQMAKATAKYDFSKTAKNCVFRSDLSSVYTVAAGSNCVFMDLNKLGVDANFYPTSTVSYVVNKGENNYADSADLDGKLRIMDGIVDIGCYEYDWTPHFEADLGHKNIDITTYSSNVVETASGNVLIGSNGSLSLNWPAQTGMSYRGNVEVTGAGTLKIYDQDGWLVGSYTKTDGPSFFTITKPNKDTSFTFVYEGGTSDASGKGALLLPFANFGGLRIYSL